MYQTRDVITKYFPVKASIIITGREFVMENRGKEVRLKMTETVDVKQKITERYKGVDPSLLEVIPAKETEEIDVVDRNLRVAAYVRVSTDNDEQKSSFELQSNEFTDQINANPRWEFAGIYSDEGISGTDLSHRTGMLQMIEDAKDGKIDLILTKSIARFARNIVDCLSIIETLKNLDPPVGVKFETDNIYTLDSTGRMILTILASVAEEESHSKSLIMNWSIDKRFSRGLFLTPKLLGYDLDEDGNLVINPDEAETVKVIYDLFINGYSFSDIAKLLTEHQRETKLGSTEWNPSTLPQIMGNERYCGDVLARKTYTPNFLNHKSKKNRNNRTQYRQRDHHEPIVSREVFNAANHVMASRHYAQKSKPLPIMSVIDDGVLRGFIPMDKDWCGFSVEDYMRASQCVCDEVTVQVETSDDSNHLSLEGYKIVRAQFFTTERAPTLTISRGRLKFNTACLRSFEDVEYVELLLNTVENCIAIRPCDASNPNAIRWGKLQNERWTVNSVSCRGLGKLLFSMMDWDEDVKYRFRGQYIDTGQERFMLFELEEPEMIKVITRVLKEETEEIETTDEETSNDEEYVLKETVLCYPDSWNETCGRSATEMTKVNVLTQHYYAGDWDVLRPAMELEEFSMLTAEDLRELLMEARTIIERWESQNVRSAST